MQEEKLRERFTPMLFSVAIDFVGIYDNVKQNFLRKPNGTCYMFNTFEDCEIYIRKNFAKA